MRRAVIAALAACLSAACDEGMVRQPKVDTYERAEAAPTVRAPPDGTVARESGAPARPEVDRALIARGREHYNVFCVPCHGRRGRGDGRIVAAGFPRPPSYHSAELRRRSAEHLFSVITRGFGVMYGYGDRVPPEDRWGIVAYIRVLQAAETAEPPGRREGRP